MNSPKRSTRRARGQGRGNRAGSRAWLAPVGGADSSRRRRCAEASAGRERTAAAVPGAHLECAFARARAMLSRLCPAPAAASGCVQTLGWLGYFAPEPAGRHRLTASPGAACLRTGRRSGVRFRPDRGAALCLPHRLALAPPRRRWGSVAGLLILAAWVYGVFHAEAVFRLCHTVAPGNLLGYIGWLLAPPCTCCCPGSGTCTSASSSAG